MTDPWTPTPIIGPDLVPELGRALYQYAVTLSGPVRTRGETGEELVSFEPIHEHVPAMIGEASQQEQRVMGTTTVEVGLFSIALGDYFPDVDENWQVMDEANGLTYDVVGVNHPVNLMTILTAVKRAPEESPS